VKRAQIVLLAAAGRSTRLFDDAGHHSHMPRAAPYHHSIAKMGTAMSQSQLSFFYRGIVIILVGGFAVGLLSSIGRPWAKNVSTIAVVVLLPGGAAFIVFVTLRQFREFVNAPVGDEPLPANLYQDSWYHVARLAVVASVLLTVILVAMLLFSEPPKQCPNWHLPGKRSTPLWLPFFMTVPLLAALVFTVARWSWVVRKAIASAYYPNTTPVSYILIVTTISLDSRGNEVLVRIVSNHGAFRRRTSSTSDIGQIVLSIT